MRAWRLARTPGGQLVGALVLTGTGLFVAIYLGAFVVLAVEAAHTLSTAALTAAAMALVGTALLGAWTTLLAGPLGTGVALWARWLAPPSLRRAATGIVRVVGDIPPACLLVPILLVPASTVFGTWALLTGAIAITAVPTVAARAVQALDRVPGDEVLQAIALGARPGEAVAAVVLPRAGADLLRAVLAGLARAIGETVIVLLVLDGVSGGLGVLTRTVALGMVGAGAGEGGVAPAAALALAVLGGVTWTAGVLVERRS